VLVDAELRPIFAQSQSLFAKRRQQRPLGDPPPPLLLSSPPNRPWAGSGRSLRPAPAVTRPRPSPTPAHYHSKRAQRHSPPLLSCRQPPPSRRAVHELGRGAANGCGRLNRPYPPVGHRRNVYIEQVRGAGKRRRQLSRLHDHAFESRGSASRYQQGDAHGRSQVSLGRRPPGSRRLVEIGRMGAPPTAIGDVYTSAIPRAFQAFKMVSKGSETEVGVRWSRGGGAATAQAPASSGIAKVAPRLSAYCWQRAVESTGCRKP